MYSNLLSNKILCFKITINSIHKILVIEKIIKTQPIEKDYKQSV